MNCRSRPATPSVAFGGEERRVDATISIVDGNRTEEVDALRRTPHLACCAAALSKRGPPNVPTYGAMMAGVSDIDGLEDLRRELDDLDTQLMALLLDRQAVIRKVIEFKKPRGIPAVRLDREEAMLARASPDRPPVSPTH
jgi:Chorismate mutase type II